MNQTRRNHRWMLFRCPWVKPSTMAAGSFLRHQSTDWNSVNGLLRCPGTIKSCSANKRDHFTLPNRWSLRVRILDQWSESVFTKLYCFIPFREFLGNGHPQKPRFWPLTFSKNSLAGKSARGAWGGPFVFFVEDHLSRDQNHDPVFRGILFVVRMSIMRLDKSRRCCSWTKYNGMNLGGIIPNDCQFVWWVFHDTFFHKRSSWLRDILGRVVYVDWSRDPHPHDPASVLAKQVYYTCSLKHQIWTNYNDQNCDLTVNVV